MRGNLLETEVIPPRPTIQNEMINWSTALGCPAPFVILTSDCKLGYPGIPTTIKTMGVNITTIVYLRVLIIQIGSTIVLMVVED